MSERATLPGAARRYIAALGVAAVAVAAVASLLQHVHSVAWSVTPPLLAVMLAAAWLIMRVQYRSEVMALDLFEAALAPAIVTLPAWLVMAMVVVAQLVANSARKNTAWKTAFNVFQWTAAAGAASLTYGALRSGGRLTAHNILALLAGLALVSVVNLFTFSAAIAFAEGGTLRAMIARTVRPIAFSASVNIAFGLLFVSAFHHNAVSVLLFLVPLAVLAMSYRGYAAAVADRTRLSKMIEASRELSAPVDPRDALPAFLEKVRETFEAQAIELVLQQDAGRLLHRVTPAGHSAHLEVGDIASLTALLARPDAPRRISRAQADPAVRALMDRDGWRDCMAAPVEIEGVHLGVLIVYDHSGPEGWEEGELAVLQTLAGEAGAAIRKGELLSQILEEREKLQAIVDNTSDGIVMLDSSGRILLWNPGFEHITGFSANEVMGSRAFDRMRPRDEHGAEVPLHRWNDVGEIPQSLEIDTASGRVVSLLCSYGRVEYGDGRPAVFIAIARDVTQRRELDRMKDDFVATVSHELRTPLTPIIGWAEMLLQYGERLDPQQRKDALTSIKRKSEDLQQLILHLLEVSKVETGGPGGLEELVDARAVAERVVVEARATRPGRTIELDLPPGDATVWGDSVCTAQIVSNLVSNALNYSPADQPVVVRVRAGEHVTLSVIDRGMGIAREDQERIFERFQRLGDHMTRSTGGTGLGLYIARRLARRIRGELTVQSHVGEGSTFTLKLPAAVVARAV